MMEAEVSTLPNYEIDILFPPGPAGILLEPVVRCGNRSIGARVVGFADNAADEDFYLKSPISDPASPSVNVHTLAAENVSLGAVLMQLDFVSTQHLSFDRIMTLLKENSNTSRRMRFKDVKSSWMHSATRGSPSSEVVACDPQSLLPSHLHNTTASSAAETLVAHFNADHDDDGEEHNASEWGLDGAVAVDEGPRGDSIFDEATAVFGDECSGDEDENESLSVHLSPHSNAVDGANDSQTPAHAAADVHTSPALLSLNSFLGASSPAVAASPFEEPPLGTSPQSPDRAEASPVGHTTNEAPDMSANAVAMAEASMASVELEEGTQLFGGHENDDEMSTVQACSLASESLAQRSPTTVAVSEAAPRHSAEEAAAQECVDLAAVAALEEMVGELLAQKLSWCEQSNAHEEAAQQAVKRCAAAEVELAASNETVALLESQAEQDASLIQDLQDRVSSAERALEVANSRAADTSSAEQSQLMRTIQRQKEELDSLLEASTTKDLNLASLDDKCEALAAELSAHKDWRSRANGALSAAQRSARREAEQVSSLRRQLAASQAAAEANAQQATEAREKVKALLESAFAAAQIQLHSTTTGGGGQEHASVNDNEEEEEKEGASLDQLLSDADALIHARKNTPCKKEHALPFASPLASRRPMTPITMASPGISPRPSSSPSTASPSPASASPQAQAAAAALNASATVAASRSPAIVWPAMRITAAPPAFDPHAYLAGLVLEAEEAENQSSSRSSPPRCAAEPIAAHKQNLQHDAASATASSTAQEVEPNSLDASNVSELSGAPNEDEDGTSHNGSVLSEAGQRRVTSALQEMLAALVQEKLAWLDEKASLKQELAEQEKAVELLAADARGDEEALRLAETQVAEMQETLRASTADAARREAEAVQRGRQLEEALAQARLQSAESEVAVVAAANTAAEQRCEALEKELHDLRLAVLELTQDDGERDEGDGDDEEGNGDEAEETVDGEALTAMIAEKEANISGLLVACDGEENDDEDMDKENTDPEVEAPVDLASPPPQRLDPELERLLAVRASATRGSALLSQGVSPTLEKSSEFKAPTPRTAALLKLCDDIDSGALTSQRANEINNCSPESAASNSVQSERNSQHKPRSSSEASPATPGGQQAARALRLWRERFSAEKQPLHSSAQRAAPSPSKDKKEKKSPGLEAAFALAAVTGEVYALPANSGGGAIAASSSSSSTPSSTRKAATHAWKSKVNQQAPWSASPHFNKHGLSNTSYASPGQVASYQKHAGSVTTPRSAPHRTMGGVRSPRAGDDGAYWRLQAQQAGARLVELSAALEAAEAHRAALRAEAQRTTELLTSANARRSEASAELASLRQATADQAATQEATKLDLEEELQRLRAALLAAQSSSSLATPATAKMDEDAAAYGKGWSRAATHSQHKREQQEEPTTEAGSPVLLPPPVAPELEWLAMQGYASESSSYTNRQEKEHRNPEESFRHDEDSMLSELSVCSELTGSMMVAVNVSHVLLEGRSTRPRRRDLEAQVAKLKGSLAEAQRAVHVQRQKAHAARKEAQLQARRFTQDEAPNDTSTGSVVSVDSGTGGRSKYYHSSRSRALDERATAAAEAAAKAAESAAQAAQAAQEMAGQRLVDMAAMNSQACEAELANAKAQVVSLEEAKEHGQAALLAAQQEQESLRTQVERLGADARAAAAARDALATELAAKVEKPAPAEITAPLSRQMAVVVASNAGAAPQSQQQPQLASTPTTVKAARAQRIAAKKKQWLAEVAQAKMQHKEQEGKVQQQGQEHQEVVDEKEAPLQPQQQSRKMRNKRHKAASLHHQSSATTAQDTASAFVLVKQHAPPTPVSPSSGGTPLAEVNKSPANATTATTSVPEEARAGQKGPPPLPPTPPLVKAHRVQAVALAAALEEVEQLKAQLAEAEAERTFIRQATPQKNDALFMSPAPAMSPPISPEALSKTEAAVPEAPNCASTEEAGEGLDANSAEARVKHLQQQLAEALVARDSAEQRLEEDAEEAVAMDEEEEEKELSMRSEEQLAANTENEENQAVLMNRAGMLQERVQGLATQLMQAEAAAQAAVRAHEGASKKSPPSSPMPTEEGADPQAAPVSTAATEAAAAVPTLQAELQALTDSRADAHAAAQAAQVEHANAVTRGDELEARLNHLQQQQQQLEQLEQGEPQACCQSAKLEVQRLQAELAEARSEAEEALAASADALAASNGEKAALEARVSDLAAAVAQLSGDADNARAAATASQQMALTRAACSQQLTEAEERLNGITAELAASADANARAVSVVANAQRAAHAARQRAREFEGRLASAEEALVHALAQRAVDLDAAAAEVEAKEALRAEAHELEQEVVTLRAELSEALDAAAKVQRDLDASRGVLGAVELEREREGARADQAQAALAAALEAAEVAQGLQDRDASELMLLEQDAQRLSDAEHRCQVLQEEAASASEAASNARSEAAWASQQLEACRQEVCDALTREQAAVASVRAESSAAVAAAVAGAVEEAQADRQRANEAWSAEAQEVSARLRAKDAELDCLSQQQAQAQGLLQKAETAAATAAAQLQEVEELLESERASFTARLEEAHKRIEARDEALVQLAGLEQELADATAKQAAAEEHAVSEARAAAESLARVHELEDAMIALDDELTAVQDQTLRQAKDTEEVHAQALQKLIEEAEAERRSLQAELTWAESALTEAREAAERDKENLQGDALKQVQSAAAQVSELTQLTAKHEELAARAQEEQVEALAALREQHQVALDQQCQDAEEQAASARVAADKASETVAASKAQIEQLEARITELVSQVAASDAASESRAAAAAQAASEAAWAAAETAAQEMAEASEAEAAECLAQVRKDYAAELATMEIKLKDAEKTCATAHATAAASAAAAEGARRQLMARDEALALERQDMELQLEAADATASHRLQQAAAKQQEQHDAELNSLQRVVELAEARASDAKQEIEASEAAKSALEERVASLDHKLQTLASELAQVRQEQEEAAQVAGAARVLDQLKAESEQRHWAAQVERAEALLEEAEQRATMAAEELNAKAEALWELERRCFEAEDEVGGLEADLDAVALRAAEAEAALDASGRARDADREAAAALKLALEAQLAEARGDAQAVEADTATLSAVVAEAEQLASGHGRKLEKRNQELEQQLAHRQRRVDELQAECAAAQAAQASAEASLAAAIASHEEATSGWARDLSAAGRREAAVESELWALRQEVSGGTIPGEPLPPPSIAGLTPGKASRARVAYLERLRSDISKLRAENARLRDQKDLTSAAVTAATPTGSSESTMEALSVNTSSTAATTAAPPAATASSLGSKLLANSSTSNRRNLAADTAAMRAANRKLHDHVQRSRTALTLIASVQARHNNNKAPIPAASAVATASAPLASAATAQPLVNASASTAAPTTTYVLMKPAAVAAATAAGDKENSRAAGNGAAPAIGGVAFTAAQSPLSTRGTPMKMQQRLERKSARKSARKQKASPQTNSAVGSLFFDGSSGSSANSTSSAIASTATDATPRKSKKSSKSGLRLFGSPEARPALAPLSSGTGL